MDTLFKILNDYYPYNNPVYLDYGKITTKKDRLGNKGSSNRKEGSIVFKNGSKIQIGGVQNIDKYLGGEYQIIYLGLVIIYQIIYQRGLTSYLLFG